MASCCLLIGARGVAGGDVADLVAEHRGQLGLASAGGS